MIKNLENRSVLVKSRLIAIDKEKEGLVIEDTALDKLITHYKNLEYDSIEEERRVTAALTKEDKSSNKGIKKGTSKYDEVFKTIFAEYPNGLTMTMLRARTIDLTGVEISPATIYNVIESAVRYGKARKENKLYYWNFEEE